VVNVYIVIDMMLSILIHGRDPMKPSAKLLTVREVAERLGLKESTIRKRILLRQIAYVKPGLRAVRIPVEELERILAAGFRPVITPHSTT
jgi:excisionase family DNA binding protein